MLNLISLIKKPKLNEESKNREIEEKRFRNIEVEKKISSLLSQEERRMYREEVEDIFNYGEGFIKLGIKCSKPDILMIKEKLLGKYLEYKRNSSYQSS